MGDLAKRNQVLVKDIKEVLEARKRSSGQVLEGGEMFAAVLEADRHKVPAIPIDRLRSVTEARFQDAIADDFARDTAKNGGVPENHHVASHLIDGDVMFQTSELRGFLMLPWTLRKRILGESRQDWEPGLELVPARVVDQAISELAERRESMKALSASELKAKISAFSWPPMPPGETQRLGPESLNDVFARVIHAERDEVLAYNLRMMTAPQATEYRKGFGGGPLVLAVIGAAHLEGVAHNVSTRSLEDLGRSVRNALERPEVPAWKREALPLDRLLSQSSLVT